MNSSTISKIFEQLQKDIPDPKTELEYTNNYTLLVAVVLSAQSTDIQVNKATKELFQIVTSPEAMLKLGEENLKKHVKTIGLFNTKAKNVIALSKKLVEKYHSEVPNNFDDLVLLPGVGEKTAYVVLNCAFGKKVIAVDTHVHRVSNRLGIVKTTSPKQTQKIINQVVPEKLKDQAHHLLILHGRYICKAAKPLCDKCSLTKFCNYYIAKAL